MKRSRLLFVAVIAVLAAGLTAFLSVGKEDAGLASTGAQQAGFSVCPPAGGWALSVWTGANNTPVPQAIATCTGVPVVAAFYFDHTTQGWLFFIAGAPESINTLRALNNLQPVFLKGATAAAPTPTPAPGPTALSGRYLLAFHACNTATTNCNDPRNHLTYIAQSDDGAAWVPVPGYQPHAGSVPDLVRRGNTLYILNPGQVRRYRIDADVWEDPIPVSVTHADGSRELFVDPSPTLDESGRIVLFYLVGQLGGDPARCPPGQSSCTKVFRSATEVAGSDGATFGVDPGNRAEVAISGFDTASDPDTFNEPRGFVLYISRGPSVQALRSAELRGAYSNVAELPGGMLTLGSGGIPAGHYDSASGQYWTYVHARQGSAAVIRRAVHGGLSAPLADADFRTAIAGGGFPGLGASFTVESPGFALNTP